MHSSDRRQKKDRVRLGVERGEGGAGVEARAEAGAEVETTGVMTQRWTETEPAAPRPEET